MNVDNVYYIEALSCKMEEIGTKKDFLSHIRCDTLARLNRDYKYHDGTLTRVHGGKKDRPVMRSLEEARDDYLAKIRLRIASLESEEDLAAENVSARPKRSKKFVGVPLSNANSISSTLNFDGIPQIDPQMHLVQCKYCPRKFRSERIDSHQSICANVKKTERPVFNETKMRVKGTELEPFNRSMKIEGRIVPKTPKRSTTPLPLKTETSKRREQMARTPKNDTPIARDLKSRSGVKTPSKTIKSAKGDSVNQVKESVYSRLQPENKLITCPHCSRKFTELAIERHVPICSKLSTAPKRTVYKK